jgi:hypothetical protein
MSIGQQKDVLSLVRWDFQEISSEEDVQRILDLKPTIDDHPEANLIRAYQAAATCRLAEFVSSPFNKLKYFNQGKQELEDLISKKKQVENVYLRMMLQLNVPRIFNYQNNIQEDLIFLDTHLPEAPIDIDYKNTMLASLLISTDDNNLRERLQQIKVSEAERN